MLGIDPLSVPNPDKCIPRELQHNIQFVRRWGKSPQHGRIVGSLSVDEMTAVAEQTGVAMPRTPAAAQGGRAKLGGYYPHKGKDKG